MTFEIFNSTERTTSYSEGHPDEGARGRQLGLKQIRSRSIEQAGPSLIKSLRSARDSISPQ